MISCAVSWGGGTERVRPDATPSKESPNPIDRKSFDLTPLTMGIAFVIDSKAPLAERSTVKQLRSRTSADEQTLRLSGFSTSWRAVILIPVVTLLVWVLFWELEMPLDPGSTAVVALIVTASVAAGQFLLSRIRRVRATQFGKPR
jgi:hypothetical protein